MKKEIYIPTIGIVIGEFLLFYDNIYQGIGIHMINILTIILVIIFGNLSLEMKNVLQSLMLLPVLRIVGLSMPQLFTNYLQYLLIYGIMLTPIFLIIKNQWTSYKELGTNLSVHGSPSFNRFYIYMPIVVLTAVMTIMIGQYINIIPNIQIPSSEVTYIIGKFMSISLIIIFSISFLLSGSKYWNKYVSNTIGIYSNPLLLTFAAIVIHRIILIMQI